MINVTKPFLPPIEEYQKYLLEIWGRAWLTNNGPLVNELEIQLKEILGVDHLMFLGNGTIALQIAIKALELKGEIITTPFSYVATTSSIVWEGLKPVFVDIDSKTLNIDPQNIEAAITPETSAILATHVYGNPCEIEAIDKIAKKHNIKVVYDAAHCFGTKYKGKSIFEYGDVSAVSFHATKVFHTTEGGALITKDENLAKRISYLRNFGHAGPETFYDVGINGKNSEFHAAMGLCNLRYIDEILKKRKSDFILYANRLNEFDLEWIEINSEGQWNHSYVPVLFETESQCDLVFDALNVHEIFSRRYFSTALNTLPYVSAERMPIAEEISKKIICLPTYFELSNSEIDYICRIIKQTLTE